VNAPYRKEVSFIFSMVLDLYISPTNGNKKSPEQWTKTQRTSHCELHYTTASLCQKLSNNIIESSMPTMPTPILTAPGSGSCPKKVEVEEGNIFCVLLKCQ